MSPPNQPHLPCHPQTLTTWTSSILKSPTQNSFSLLLFFLILSSITTENNSGLKPYSCRRLSSTLNSIDSSFFISPHLTCSYTKLSGSQLFRCQIPSFVICFKYPPCVPGQKLFLSFSSLYSLALYIAALLLLSFDYRVLYKVLIYQLFNVLYFNAVHRLVAYMKSHRLQHSWCPPTVSLKIGAIIILSLFVMTALILSFIIHIGWWFLPSKLF